jgi:thymidylate synthase (FAD)
MKVTLINYTRDAAETLIFTKNTRLNMTSDSMDKVMAMSDEEKAEHLSYMTQTIKSSWEFVDYTFLIEGVTRAFTHQFVRNRQGSYAQQTMRILNVSGFDYSTGPSIKSEYHKVVYDQAMDYIQKAYNYLIDTGVKIEDARGILPTNIHTNIVAKYNLRTLSDLVASRSSPRTQAEFREVMEAMYQAVIKVHPWAAEFLKDQKVDAAKKLDSFIHDTLDGTEECAHYLKQVDILRK